MKNYFSFNKFASILNSKEPDAIACIYGNANNPLLCGQVLFYDIPLGGVLINAEVNELPDRDLEAVSKGNSRQSNQLLSNFFGMHIHEFGNCTPPFDKTGSHYNPNNTLHPQHAGDLPPLLSNNGYAWSAFFDERISIKDIIGKSVVIHRMRDDFTSQPAGDSGEKIGCGVINSLY